MTARPVHNDIVGKSVAMGARPVSVGTHEGLFYRPTVLADVRPGMPAFDEEIFGPVMPVTVVDSEHEAIELVNGCPMLMNSVFSADLIRGMRVAEQSRAGEVHGNDAHARHGAENQMPGFTKRQWIGVQRTPLEMSPRSCCSTAWSCSSSTAWPCRRPGTSTPPPRRP